MPRTRITQGKIFVLRLALVMQILDTCSDYNIAIQYLLNGKTTSFISIICLMQISSLINVLISRRIQQQDQKQNFIDTDDYYCKILHLITKSNLFLVIAVPLKLAPIVHYWKTLKYALKTFQYEQSKDFLNETQYCSMTLKKHKDASLLRVFECYLDAAPQQILQLTLMLNSYNNKMTFKLHHVISIFFATVHMGMSMVEYNSVIRIAQEDKLNIDGIGKILQFFWHFGITASRILSLSIIASIWPISVIICCIIHWIGMTIWNLIDKKKIGDFDEINEIDDHLPRQSSIKTCIYSILFSSLIGIIYIFMYINTADSNTIWKYVSFYILCFLENTISNSLWEIYCPPAIRKVWYFKFHIISFVSFGLGIIAMVLYYTIFHPSKRNNLNGASSNISNIANEEIELRRE